jgi:CysZ protein
VLSEFFSGFQYLFRGFSIIRRPGLRRFVLIPLLINILVFSLAIWLGVDQFAILLEWLLPEGDAWWIEIARVTLWILFSAVIFLIIFFTFTLIANLLGAPFNGLLSEKVEKLLSGTMQDEAGGVRELIRSVPSSIMSEIRKFTYFIATGAVLFLLTFLPGVNVLSPLLWVLFSSWMLAIEYIAYPMENHNMFFRQVKVEVKKKRMISFGFGLAVMLATLIPLVNFFVMPSAVAGATALWAERLSRKDFHVDP